VDRDFAGKVALITGGGSGIGRETALLFARRGARVAVADLNEGGGHETVRIAAAAEGDAFFVRCDVTAEPEVEAMVAATVARYGRLDCAVNSAGVGGVVAKAADYPVGAWRQVVEINLTGVFLSMRHEIPAMLASGGGAVVNVASVAGVTGFPMHAAYAASKHGVVGLTRSAALDYVRHNVRINAVCPGFTRTPMVEEGLKQMNPKLGAQLEQRIPLGRLGEPSEIAAGIVYLCTDAAAFIIGHELVLDGGIVAG
jgi:NAD(P)-dependent dehydrogenase (short-subunit alcohol dehydrogenase family)